MGRPKGSKNKPKLIPSKEEPKKVSKSKKKQAPGEKSAAPLISEKDAAVLIQRSEQIDAEAVNKALTIPSLLPKTEGPREPPKPSPVDLERQKAIDAYNRDVESRLEKFRREVQPGDPDVLKKWFEALGPSSVDW